MNTRKNRTMRHVYAHCLFALLFFFGPQAAMASVWPQRSSVQSFSDIRLTIVEESDTANLTDRQDNSLSSLGPVIATATIDSDQGFYTATTDGSASFFSPRVGSFECSMSYLGNRAKGDIDAQLYSQTLNGIFQYDFVLPSEGSVNISGVLHNGGPSSLSYFATVEVLGESQQGHGFNQPLLQESIRDFQLDSEPFDFDVPLELDSGSYRIQIRLAHSALGQLDVDLSVGSLSASWNIQSDSDCPADFNNDGTLDFLDISAFLAAYLDQEPAADLNNDDAVDFLDITAFLTSLADGCPGDD